MLAAHQLLVLIATISAAMTGTSLGLSAIAQKIRTDSTGETRRKAKLALKLSGLASMIFLLNLIISLGTVTISNETIATLGYLTYLMFVVGCAPFIQALLLIYGCAGISFHLHNPITAEETRGADAD